MANISVVADIVSAQIISDVYTWAPGVVGRNNYFVSLVNNQIVYASSAHAVVGISLQSLANNQSVVCLFGIVNVYDNGKCVPGMKCTVNNDIAVTGTQWLVLSRISPDMISILFK